MNGTWSPRVAEPVPTAKPRRRAARPPRYCVLVERDDETFAIGAFASAELAANYARTLPPGTAVGLAEAVTTHTFRVRTGDGIPIRRHPDHDAAVDVAERDDEPGVLSTSERRLAAALNLLRFELSPVLADIRGGVLTTTDRRDLAETLEGIADVLRATNLGEGCGRPGQADEVEHTAGDC